MIIISRLLKELSDHQLQEARKIFDSEGSIKAIKYLTSCVGASLADSKALVDHFAYINRLKN